MRNLPMCAASLHQQKGVYCFDPLKRQLIEPSESCGNAVRVQYVPRQLGARAFHKPNYLALHFLYSGST